MAQFDSDQPDDSEEPDLSDQPAEQFHRDRREHGGMGPATDAPQPFDVTTTEEYQEERAETRREFDRDELQIERERGPLPPTHYDE
jgi:hypothetical protein